MQCPGCGEIVKRVDTTCLACGAEFAPELRSLFSPDEWLTVELMPLWVAYGIAFADGRMDPAEAATICEQLAHPELYRVPLMHEVLHTVACHADEAVARYQADTRTIDDGLAEGAKIIDRHMTASDAKLFKESLMALADKVAEASGGFFGLGNRWSREESEMAARMMSALGLSFDPHTKAFR